MIDLSSSRTFALDKLMTHTEAGEGIMASGWDDDMDLKVAKLPSRAVPRTKKDKLKLSVSAAAVHADDEDIDLDM